MTEEDDLRPQKPGEAGLLIASAGLVSIVVGLATILRMYLAELEKYQTGPYIGGLVFFGMIVTLATFFVILLYGVPVHLIFRRLGIRRFRYYFLAGLAPALPVFIMDFPELYATLRIALFGIVATSSSYLVRFVSSQDS